MAIGFHLSLRAQRSNPRSYFKHKVTHRPSLVIAPPEADEAICQQGLVPSLFLPLFVMLERSEASWVG